MLVFVPLLKYIKKRKKQERIWLFYLLNKSLKMFLKMAFTVF